MESFKDHCLKLFPVNRLFASSSQISQVAKEFCDAWGISSTCWGKKRVCYYGNSPIRTQPRELTWAWPGCGCHPSSHRNVPLRFTCSTSRSNWWSMLRRRLNYSFRSRLPFVIPILPARWIHSFVQRIITNTSSTPTNLDSVLLLVFSFCFLEIDCTKPSPSQYDIVAPVWLL
jgi:hypothetical protein